MKLPQRIGAYLNFSFAIVVIGSLVFTIGFGMTLYMMRQEVTANVDNLVKLSLRETNCNSILTMASSSIPTV